jgi:hypothetical protein
MVVELTLVIFMCFQFLKDRQHLKQRKMSFFSFTKSENRRAEQVSWYQWEGGGGGEKVWEGEYGANTVYTCM